MPRAVSDSEIEGARRGAALCPSGQRCDGRGKEHWHYAISAAAWDGTEECA
jgi:hypothetical protein